MKSSALLFFFGLHALAVLAQTLSPSPTESVGCVPHNDHWYVAQSTSFYTLSRQPHRLQHDIPSNEAFRTLIRIYRDCDGPRPTTSAGTPPATTVTPTSSAHDHNDDDDDHTDASGSGTLGPSPTASVGCEPHGDHWHCDGPRPAGTTINSITSGVAAGAGALPTTTRATTAITAGAASDRVIGVAPMLGLAVLAAFGL
jgi:hypothetical protein